MKILNDEEAEMMRMKKINYLKEYYNKKRNEFTFCDHCNKRVRCTELKMHLQSKFHQFYLLPMEEQIRIKNEKKEHNAEKSRQYARKYYNVNIKKRPSAKVENIVVENFSAEYIV
jgi:hypothetical protein